MKTMVLEHERWMRRALDLARRGEGLTRPNPPVGAVVVRHGRVVGEGWHPKAGQPHAEALALATAGRKAAGAVLYVTLEPCCTHGRTPPCTEAILRHGVRTVVVATRDPNPQHRGRGLTALRRAGVEVIEGVVRAEARDLLAPFARWIVSQTPWVTLKLGTTLDGKIADATGHSKWITSPASRRWVQVLRRRADAILVGANTVIVDNPSLLPHPELGRKPWRVVVDGRGRVPATVRLLTDEARERTIMVTTEACPLARRKAWQRQGSQVWVLPATPQGGVALDPMLRQLGALGVMHGVCEGGGELAASLIRSRQVDELWWFVAPRVMGGGGAVNAVGGAGWRLEAMPTWTFMECRPVGPDLWIRARPKAQRA